MKDLFVPFSSAGAHRACARRCEGLKGCPIIPGDKSLSHRAVILSALALGQSQIFGLLESADIRHTRKAMEALGAVFVKRRCPPEEALSSAEPGFFWQVEGVGNGSLLDPGAPLYFGNAGTGARLVLGLLASYDMRVVFTGDVSLSARPMARLIKPLEEMGAHITAREGNFLPLCLQGAQQANPIRYRLPVASAQVKSALLLAGLNTAGYTTVIDPYGTRDHTEKLFHHFEIPLEIGAHIEETPYTKTAFCKQHTPVPTENIGYPPNRAKARHHTLSQSKNKIKIVTVTGQSRFYGKRVDIPADPSSAAFFIVAALLIPNSDIVLKNILMNPTRTGFLTTLQEMGACIEILEKGIYGGECVATLRIRSSPLTGIFLPKERVPSMIDEYPILSVAAAFAEGESVMEGLEELRVKESNRLKAIAEGLKNNGVFCEEGCDSLRIIGSPGGKNLGGGSVRTYNDHRIAMSFLVFGLASAKPVWIDDTSMIATSFPDFLKQMRALGAPIEEGV